MLFKDYIYKGQSIKEMMHFVVGVVVVVVGSDGEAVLN